MTKIAFFDDDPEFAQMVIAGFLTEGIEVLHFQNGSYAEIINWKEFSCVILDLEMPFVDGHKVLHTIPDIHRPFTLVVSSHGDLKTRLDTLENGADFFMTKPIDIEELLLLAKREFNRPKNIEEGIWILNAEKLSVTSPAGKRLSLSITEKNLLEILMSFEKVTIEKDDLYFAMFPSAATFDSNGTKRIEVALSRLRGRFREVGEFLPVKSVRNKGYIFLERSEIIN